MTPSRQIPATLMIAIVGIMISGALRSSHADVFTDIGEGISRVTGLRGLVKGIAGGAAEGVRDELDKFVDEKVDPMLSRVDKILNERIQQATTGAITVVHEMERALQATIDQAAVRIDGLTASFFFHITETLDLAFARTENLLDTVICRLLPDGTLNVSLGPFGGRDEIKVRRPARTYCYSNTLAAQGDPDVAIFRRWEFFRGELCEYELKLDRISPTDSHSIEQVAKGYEKLAEMADSARCAAPDPASKSTMYKRLHKYQSRADFFRRLEGGGNK